MRQISFFTWLACALALVWALAASAQSSPGESTTTATTTNDGQADAKAKALHKAKLRAEAVRTARLRRLVAISRRRTWHWQRVMGTPLTLTLRHPSAALGARATAWKRIATTTKRIAFHPPHLRAWLCIHAYEGGWNDPNAPYYGGLQMDIGFQQTYGARLLMRKGTADHWTPLEQMWVAERAFRAGRGFFAWPNTARICGLL
jgi:hypothetical protein